MYDNYSSSIGGPSSGSSSLGGGGGGAGASADDQKVAQAIAAIKLQMELAERIHKINLMCWDTCDLTPKDRLDGKQETCMKNCTERYMDTEKHIRSRLIQKIQQQAGGGSFS